MINPLFISPEYLSDDVNGTIERLFINALNHNKFEPTVLCCKSSTREDGLNHVIAIKRNYEVAKFENKHYKSLKLPDGYFLSWFIRCILFFLFNKNHFKIDYIHTYSVPYTTHILGYYLKKLLKVKWVVQFYEPWSDNMYLNLDALPKYKKKVQRWEGLIAENADLIIHNSEIAKERWISKYGANSKVKSLNLPFNPKILGNNIDISFFNTGDVIITHIGNLYNLRKGKDVILGASRFRDSHPELFPKLKVFFIGKIQNEDRNLVASLNLEDTIIMLGSKTEEECLPYFVRSDAFISIDGEGQGLLFFPSKLIKYYYFKKPILGITDLGSVLDKELKNTNHTSIRHNEPGMICDFFYNLFTSRDSLYKFDKDAWKRFEVSCVVSDYEKLLIDNQIL